MRDGQAESKSPPGARFFVVVVFFCRYGVCLSCLVLFFYVDRTNQKLTQGKISSLVKLRMWNRIFFLFSVSAHATGHTSGGNHHW